MVESITNVVLLVTLRCTRALVYNYLSTDAYDKSFKYTFVLNNKNISLNINNLFINSKHLYCYMFSLCIAWHLNFILEFLMHIIQSYVNLLFYFYLNSGIKMVIEIILLLCIHICIMRKYGKY